MSVLVRSFYYTPDASFCEESSYIPRAGFSEEFPLRDTPDANFSEEFLLHS